MESLLLKLKKLDKEKKSFPQHIRLTARRQKQFLKQRHSHWKKAATNATITRENGAFVITDEVQGKTIDAEAYSKSH